MTSIKNIMNYWNVRVFADCTELDINFALSQDHMSIHLEKGDYSLKPQGVASTLNSNNALQLEIDQRVM